MGFIELFEIGFFMAFVNWSNWMLTVLVYAVVAIGAAVQWLLLAKCRSLPARGALVGVCAVGVLLCECAWHAVTGWDRLAVDVFYGGFVCLLLGAALAVLLRAVLARRRT